MLATADMFTVTISCIWKHLSRISLPTDITVQQQGKTTSCRQISVTVLKALGDRGSQPSMLEHCCVHCMHSGEDADVWVLQRQITWHHGSSLPVIFTGQSIHPSGNRLCPIPRPIPRHICRPGTHLSLLAVTVCLQQHVPSHIKHAY